MQCDQEMCPMWDGHTCPCETFGLDKDDLPTRGVFTVESPSAFEDAPPIRTHDDGSQTYGPYANNKKED